MEDRIAKLEKVLQRKKFFIRNTQTLNELAISEEMRGFQRGIGKMNFEEKTKKIMAVTSI